LTSLILETMSTESNLLTKFFKQRTEFFNKNKKQFKAITDRGSVSVVACTSSEALWKLQQQGFKIEDIILEP